MCDKEWSGSAFSNLTEGDNLTLTCAARNIQGPINLPYSSVLTTTMRVIQSIYYLVIILASLLICQHSGDRAGGKVQETTDPVILGFSSGGGH